MPDVPFIDHGTKIHLLERGDDASALYIFIALYNQLHMTEAFIHE
jgi:hypothetical protein